jgi:FdhD protein
VTAGAAGPARSDVVAVEEPLEIRVAGDTVAITMRTPGADHALAAGFGGPSQAPLRSASF